MTTQAELSASQSQLNSSIASAPPSAKKLETQRFLSESLSGGVVGPKDLLLNHSTSNDNFRILAYQQARPPPVPQGYVNPQRVLHLKNVNPASSCKKKSTLRHIPDKPERILDAPEILDDYYLNPLDWGANGLLAVALKNQLYLWNAVTGDIRLLVELPGQDYLCSVQFSTDAPDYLALGLSTGEVFYCFWCEFGFGFEYLLFKNMKGMERFAISDPFV